MKCKKFIGSLWLSAFLVTILSLPACTEIFEPSIEKSQLKPLSPENGYISNDPTVNFWFEPLEYALYYRLQVVKQSFDSIEGLVLGTLINRNVFSYELNSGSYQWRVRAENGSSRTRYSPDYSIRITSPSTSIFFSGLNDRKLTAEVNSENLFE